MRAPVWGAKCPELSNVLLKSLYLVTKCKHEPMPPDPAPLPRGGALSVEWPPSGREQPTVWGDSRTLRTAEGWWFLGAQPRGSSSGHVPVPVLDPFLLKLAQVGVAFCPRTRTPPNACVCPQLGLFSGSRRRGRLRGGRAPGRLSSVQGDLPTTTPCWFSDCSLHPPSWEGLTSTPGAGLGQ